MSKKAGFRYSKIEEYINPPEGGHSGCPGCGAILALRYFMMAIGGEVIFVMPPHCTGVTINRPAPSFGEEIRILANPFMTTSTVAGGLSAALRAKGDDKTTVVAWTGDGATFDIGMGCLSGSAERNDDIIYVCYDNEAYMNTGNQRSSATPQGTKTSTNPILKVKREKKKDMLRIIAGHNVPYAATASIAYPEDLMKKVKRAKAEKGFRFLHILTPCPTGWLYPSDKTIEVARLAVKSGYFPLLEIRNGNRYKINNKFRKVAVEDFLSLQGRFKGVKKMQLELIKKEINERLEFFEYLDARNE